jgi:hypothetical protein
MLKAFLLLLLIIISGARVPAQGKLTLYPESIEFKDAFHRLQNVYFINTGDSALTISDIAYNADAYFLRFDKSWYYPIQVQPGDTLLMDCILQNNYIIAQPNMLDTMSVYTDNNRLLGRIQIKIDYYDENRVPGTISGKVTNGNNPVPGTVIFFYCDNLNVQSTTTDANGNYFAALTPGLYNISAKKDSFYVTFYGQQTSPLSSRQVDLKPGGIDTANISLIKMNNTAISISGYVNDPLAGVLLKKAIVVIRKGTHTPSKPAVKILTDSTQPGIYTAIADYNGSYKINNITQPGYYYVQAFSDYYVPSYYNYSFVPSAFWQKADSVYLSAPVQGINLYLSRDSSFGNGTISGKILPQNVSGNSDSAAIVYAQTANKDSAVFAYSFTDTGGSYTISNLPYGSYILKAQKIGLRDLYSKVITIDSITTAIKGIDLNFNFTAVNNMPAIPGDFKLFQNYPNPFNPSTTIGYFLPYGTKVTLRIVNLLGQEVSVLENRYSSAGNHKVLFNAAKLSSGIYFVNLIANDKLFVEKIVLLK